jgi:flagellar hook protein FlgE
MGLSSVGIIENGLNASATGIAVVGNNLANTNTVGFKSSRIQFDNVLTQVMGETSSLASGQGVEVQTIMTQFTQGTLQTTNDPLDFAIDGDGFFIVKNKTGETSYTRNGEFSLDKSGNVVNADGSILQGYLADSSGNISKSLTNLNFALDASGNITIPAQATSSATVSVNLNSNDKVPALNLSVDSTNNTIVYTDGLSNTCTATIASGTYTTGSSLAAALQSALNTALTAKAKTTPDTFTVTFDATTNALKINNTGANNVTLFATGSTATSQQFGFASGSLPVTAGGQAASSSVDWAANFTAASGPASGTYDYSQSMTVYDSAGNTHLVNIYFAKAANADGTWNTNNWNTYAVSDTAKPDANGNISHNYQYQRITGLTFSTSKNSSGQTISTLASPAAPVNFTLSWDSSWGAATSQTVSIKFDNSTQYGSSDSATSQDVNGYAAGGYTSFKLNDDGTLDGVYSNGQEKTLAQLVLAKFNAPTQLQKEGNNSYVQTSKSGAATLSTPGTGGAGTVSGASLEVSNVDTATEFVNLISLQRAFTENTTVMTTTNEMFTTMLAEKA